MILFCVFQDRTTVNKNLIIFRRERGRWDDFFIRKVGFSLYGAILEVGFDCICKMNAQYSAETFKNLRFLFGHDFPRGFCCNT